MATNAGNDIFKLAFNGFRDEVINKKRFRADWNHYCEKGTTSGGKDQPEFPPMTVGSFTTLLAVAQLRPLNHPKTVKKNRGLFSLVSIKYRNN